MSEELQTCTWGPENAECIVFRVASRTYGLTQRRSTLDFYLVDTDSGKAVDSGTWEQIAGAVARLLAGTN